jgi:hypothetical protein
MTDELTPTPAGISGADIATTGARSGQARAGASRSAYTVAAAAPPVLTSIAPTSAVVGGAAFTLTATGSNFESGAVLLWNGDPLPTTRVSATQLTAPVTPPATGTGGAVSVVVRNPTLALSAPQTFTVQAPAPPVLTAIAPTSATIGDGVFSLTATGSSFDTGAVIVANGVALPTTRISPTQLTTPINLAGVTPGTVPVLVRNGTEAQSAPQSFVVHPAPVPVLDSIFPSERNVGDVFALSAFGSIFSDGAVIVWNGSEQPTTRVSATELRANMDLGGSLAGTVPVLVRNPTGTESATLPFQVDPSIIPGQRLPAIVIGGVPSGSDASRRVLVESLTIHDQLNEVPNTCTLTVQGNRPSEGSELVIAYGSASNPARLFAGNVVRVTQLYVVGRPVNVLWQVEGIDYTWALNRRLVIGRYTSLSASAIALDLVAKWAPAGFTTGIEAGLPVLDEISFTNTPLMDAFAQLATRIGGYAECDYFKVIRLWLTATGTPPTALTPTHPSLQEFQVMRDLSQVVTRALVEGGGANALALVPPGETRIPVEDATWYADDGGRLTSGPQRLTYTGRVEAGGGAMASAVGGGTGNTAPLSAPTVGTAAGAGLPAGTYRYAYTWTTTAGESLPSPMAPFNTASAGGPSAAPSATPKAGAGLGSGSYRYCYTWVTATGETVASPVATASTTSTATAPPTNGPSVTPGLGAGLAAGSYTYAVTFTTATGETTRSTNNAGLTASQASDPTIAPDPHYIGTAVSGKLTPDTDYKVGYFYAADNQTPSPYTTKISPLGTIRTSTLGGQYVDLNSNISGAPSGGKYWLCIAAKGTSSPLYYYPWDNSMTNIGKYFTDAELVQQPQANQTVNNCGKAQAILANIPIGPAGVTGRKLYRTVKNGSTSTFGLCATINNNVATSLATPDTLADSSLGPAPPATNTTTQATQQVTLAGIAAGPSGVTSRKLYRTVVNGGTYYLLTTIAGNAATTYTDAAADSALGTTQPPTTSTAVLAQAVLSAIAVGPTLTNGRKVYRTVKNGSALKLLATITNNTATTLPADALADASLGVTAPTTDTSGLPSQSEGGQVNAGSTTIPVASVDPFKPEGWCSVGHQLVRYRGVSATALTGIPPEGPGSLTVSIPYSTPITVVPQVTGIPASGPGAIVLQILPGDEVNLLVIIDDVEAQTALAGVLGGDGVVEEYQQDRRINLAEATARAAALLDLKRDILETYRYRVRDPLTRSGTTVAVDLPAPTDVHGTYEIQDVTISGFLGTDEYPFYDVTASSRRFTFEDLLRRRRAALGG